MKRVIVVGVTGSGKTTLARALSEKMGCNFVDLDDLFWLPGWVEQEESVFRSLVEKSTPPGESWTVSGNYSRVRDASWPKADTLIWLDYPLPAVFFQLLRRTLTRIAGKTPVCNGNYEGLRKALSKDSILFYLLKSYGKQKRQYRELFSDTGRYPHLNYIRLGSRAETAHFLQHVKIKKD